MMKTLIAAPLMALIAAPAMAHSGAHMHPHSVEAWVVGLGVLAIAAAGIVAIKARK